MCELIQALKRPFLSVMVPFEMEFATNNINARLESRTNNVKVNAELFKCWTDAASFTVARYYGNK